MKSNYARTIGTLMFCLFAGTSVWFAPNAIAGLLAERVGATVTDIKSLTAAVQYGFLTGTATLTITMLGDRMNPKALFFGSSAMNAVLTLIPGIFDVSFQVLMFCRFLTGFFLASIYPITIKLAASIFPAKARGLVLGFVVGSLALGAAFPHLLKSAVHDIALDAFLYAVAAFSLLGGIILTLFISPGPYLGAPQPFSFEGLKSLLANNRYRLVVIGFMGHMWELFTLWILIPLMWRMVLGDAESNISIMSLISIGMGLIGCIIGGIMTMKRGSRFVAWVSLLISSLLCIAAPFLGLSGSHTILYWMLPIWGMAVIADSPQFSSLAASVVPPNMVGTAIACMTCLGYAISAISIQLLIPLVDTQTPFEVALMLAPGPLLSLYALRRLGSKAARNRPLID